MEFFSNWAFWIIIAVIIVMLAIIGYLAEGTELGPKKKNKKKNETKVTGEVEEINITEETNAPSAWTGEIKKDERHEQVHDVPTIDDWSSIPTDLQIQPEKTEDIDQKTSEITTPLFTEPMQDTVSATPETINEISQKNEIEEPMIEEKKETPKEEKKQDLSQINVEDIWK